MSRQTLVRYVAAEITRTCVMTLGVLLAITLTLFLAELLGGVSEGEVAPNTLGRLLLLRLPEAALLVGPLALLLGLLMSLGDLAQNRETAIMRAAGMPPRQIVRAVVLLAALWAVCLLAISGWVSPWASQRTAALAQQLTSNLVAFGIRAGQFQSIGGSRLNVYTERVDPDTQRLERIFIYWPQPDSVEVISARAGHIRNLDDSRRVLDLIDGVHLSHAANDTAMPIRRIEFERNRIELPAAPEIDEPAATATMTLTQLVASSNAAAGVELQWRLAPAIATLAIALLTLPVTRTGERGGRFGVVLVALVFYLVYSNGVNLVLARLETVPVWRGVGAWPVHALVFMLAGGIAFRWWQRW